MFCIVDGNNYFRMKMNASDYFGVRGLLVDLAALKPNWLVWDGYNGNAKRRAIFSDYKKKRREHDVDTDFETLNMIRKDILPHLGCMSIWADGFEGDDVVAFLAAQKAGEEVTIISTDKDLSAIPNAKTPLVAPEFAERCGGKKFIPLFKTLVGDPSDGIPGLKGFGKGNFEKLLVSEKELLLSSLKAGYLLEGLSNSKLASKFAENWNDIMTYYKVVSFLPLSFSDTKIVVGDDNQQAIDDVLRERGVL